MRRLLTILGLAALLPAPLLAQRMRADSAFLAQMRWRSIGPATMAGRVSGVTANPLNPKVIYVGFATGGLWKSVNAGTTWEPVFDRTGAHAVSEVAIAPSDTSVVWVGTGEEDSRNSISPGNGVYKSTDGGRTWANMGLRETQHIGRVLIHPTNPNVVWVAALGHAWGPNRDRGLYKTTDGGTTWRLVKFISDRAGFVDVTLDPSNPDVLYATSWLRQRTAYSLQSGGPGSGLWKSTDGGETWAAVTGNGLPTTTWGRASVAVAPSAPSTVYVLVEADSNPNPESVRAARVRGFVPDTTKKAQLQSGLFRSTDAGGTWTRMNGENNRPFYFSQIRVDPRNPDRVYWLSVNARYSNDGGRTYRTVGSAIHVDYHAMWIDPNDPDHYLVGQDGGLSQTWDRGRTYDALLQMAVGQFYAVAYDMQRPFWVCGGLQDNGEWCGPTESPLGRIYNEQWTSVNGGDGFYAQIDPTDADVIYVESQGGSINRLNLRSWERRSIRPGVRPGGAGAAFGFGGQTLARVLEDSLLLARGDTTQPLTPDRQHEVDSLRARIAADTAYLSRNRFNWSTPFLLSPHNTRTLYIGGQRVWKSVDRGDTWVPISEDLSTRDTMKLRVSLTATGGITSDITSAETHGTVVTLAESPVRPGILFAGTDDGNVWLSRNDGVAWENLTSRFPGVPRATWVTRVEPSAFDSATVYVSFDGHRNDDFKPYVFVSTDFGRTFRSISANLPATEYVHVVREHPRRRDILFVGTELTAYVSTDAGSSWHPFNAGLPPAPVHDLKIHSRDHTLIAATHGRSIYTVDIGPLEQASDSLLGADVAVFAPEPALMYSSRAAGGGVGSRGSKIWSAPNPPTGVRIPIRIRGEEPPMARGPRPGADTAQANPLAMVFGEQAAEYMGQAGLGGGPGGGAGGIMALLMGGPARPAGDTVRVSVTDVRGDTVRTFWTNARPSPLKWVTWDMRRDRTPLGPAGVRDSVRGAQRMAFLRDSIRTAMQDTTGGRQPAPGGLQALFRDPQPREPGQFNNPLQRLIGGGGGGGGFGGIGGLLGGTGPMVEPGTYLITVRLNGRDYKQVARIERPEQTSALSGGWR